MFTSTLHLVPLLCLHLSVTVTTAGNTLPYIPTEIILLNCGESSNTQSDDGRQWTGDVNSKFISSSNSETTKSFVAQAAGQDESVTLVPYMTARIILSKFTYTFPITPGPKFLRLYFYPESYSGFDITTSFFSVSTSTYTLLNNFSAYLTCSAVSHPVASIIKEFVITASDDQILNVTFTPSPMSFAFINGIEVVSMPDNLYAGQSDGVKERAIFVITGSIFHVDNYSALETAYRLNVGGDHIPGTDDTGMFREWRSDLDYIYGAAYGFSNYFPNATIKYNKYTPAYIAPVSVYTTSRSMGPTPAINRNYNLTWIFPVDPGFTYMVRLNFCEIDLEVKYVNEIVFSISINNRTAIKKADIVSLSGGRSIPVYMDFLLWVPIEKWSKTDLWLALHPLFTAEFADAFLNGLEIFKLNSSDGNLAGKNPEVAPKLPPESKISTNHERVIIIGAVLGGVFAFSLLCLLIVFKDSVFHTRVSLVPFSSRKTSSKTLDPPQPSDNLCTHFCLPEIKAATNNFDDLLIIGIGGFGNVYKGWLVYNEYSPFAIKRLNPGSQQGAQEFKTEIEMLSQLRHKHLVSLVGYCDDDDEMILVYNYMARGTLRDHLYNSDNPPLPWTQRLQICIGAARGLHYLHTGANHVIIHRDVKTTNILLDEKWVAKVSDFGLSKIGPSTASQSHVSTKVKGTFGYLDPDYFLLQRLTEKSDVYSFGVVLFEVLCARPPVLQTDDPTRDSLAFWVQECYDNGTFDQIVDPFLKGKIVPESLNKFVEVAMRCLHKDRYKRPSFSEVAFYLEFALRLQNGEEEDGVVVENPIAPQHLEKAKMSLEGHATDHSARLVFGSLKTFSENA